MTNRSSTVVKQDLTSHLTHHCRDNFTDHTTQQQHHITAEQWSVNRVTHQASSLKGKEKDATKKVFISVER